MVLTKRTSNLPLICQICGDKARGINFDIMTCMSCKAFFRRHALQPIDLLHCQLDNDCEITRFTRSGCSACRLRKCFSLGMNSKLIRNKSQNHQRQLKKKNRPLLPEPQSRNLLRNDCSLLTTDEWNLLSNILHAYDRTNAVPQTRYMLKQQASLPPKLRTKPTVTLDIVGFFYTTIQSFFECLPYFHDLSIDARRALVQHNSDTVGTINSIFLVRETNALDSPAYAVGTSNLYGSEQFTIFKKYLSELDRNGTLIKIMLLTIAFSSNCSIVTPDHGENISTISSSISLLPIQNIFVTMLWKYLNYQYGFLGAIKCFNSLVKFILNTIRWMSEKPNVQHWDMVDTIVENTARSLTIDD